MTIKEDLRQIIKPYYWINILLSISYATCKRTPVICTFLHSECELDTREMEILFFLMIVVMLRSRKAGSVTMINYLTSSFAYTKIANLVLWFYADIRYGLVFGAIFILCGLVLPEPTYSGPEQVTYFRGHQSLEEELKRSPDTVWLVCLFAAWHPACVNFAPVFAELSASYSLTNLRFGKIDVGRFPDAAKKHRVEDGPTSRQLPTLLLMKNGDETARRPQPDLRTRKLQKFLFSKDNIKAAFDLDSIYEECKKKLSDRKALKNKSD